MDAKAASQDRPRVGGVVFLTVFLDIVGFSILFPLFPALLEHYLALEGEGSALARFVSWLEGLASGEQLAVVTLFGGALGSIYSLLQFLFAPMWGGLSDRVGRRKTLLVTLTGTVVGYVLWIFSGSFALLVASRILNGIAAGNISVASAAIADTTTGRDRAKGMAVVGIAIGLGFVAGPAIGGLMSAFDWSSGAAGALALNPFSAAAAAAAALAVINLLWVARRFPETLPPERRGLSERSHTLNPFAQLRRIDLPGVRLVCVVSLIYLTAFSGMEFTLVFLAVERLAYGPMQNAWMFVFIGLMIAFVQGGIVRRMAPKRGEKPLALAGLALTVPGFFVVGLAHDASMLYLGLGMMAAGSALVMPTLSALVSRYSPEDRQGLALGVYRSIGSLSRAAGPIVGALIYWKLGSAWPYFIGGGVLLLPFALALSLPPAPVEAEPAAA
jgi:MFS family permease